ncbi:MAG: caspase family protein [Pseudomonadota bacterium]
MNDFNKIGALQSAAVNLITQLSNLAVNSGDVLISLIPFEIDVNVGTSNVNASWLRWDLWDSKSRVALVIGNSNYQAVGKLENPANDARDVAAALRKVGFTEVIERYDLGVRDMRRELGAFEDMANGADWAIIYYAGHGIEVDRKNFLIPVDAILKRSADVEDETVELDRVFVRLAGARKLQLVILDACRNNPFASRMVQVGALTRSVGTRGLGPVEPTYPNLLVAYSARDGQVALDGSGGHSPYALALTKRITEPGLELGKFFRLVRDDVLKETGNKQRPFEYGSLTSEDLYFRPQ